MDYKKLKNIKTPEEWVDPLMDLEQREKRKINFAKRQIWHKIRVAVLLVLGAVVLGTGITVTASASDAFRSFLNELFGRNEVSEVHLESDERQEQPDIQANDENILEMQENIWVVGEKESFISEYHVEKDKEIVDRVYKVQGTGLKEMTFSTFQGDYDGQPFSFCYVMSGQEIYGFQYQGAVSEVFSYADGDTVYAALWQEDKDSVEKECIAALNVKTGAVTKLSGDTMICNFLMSPNGKVILCNHRAEGYWSVFDIHSRQEKKIRQISGYLHTDEIEFMDDDHILTLGKPFMKKGEEQYSTYLVNLQTRKVENEFMDNGEIGMQWSYRQKGQAMTIYNIINGKKILMKKISQSIHPIDVQGEYVLLGNLEDEKAPFYLVDLERQRYKKIDIPDAFRSGLELHLVKSQEKMLVTSGKSAYLVDVSKF